MAQPSRVQTLVDSGLAAVPPQYIQPPEHRVGALRHDAAAPPIAVPIIDLDPQAGDSIPDIRRACKDWGAFQVINHGVPISLLEEMKRVGLAFFQSPTEAKLRYGCGPKFPASEGYGSKMLANDEGVLDWRDYFDHHTLPESRRNPNRWPDYPDNYRQ